MQHFAVKLRVFQRQRHVIGNRAQQRFIGTRKRPALLIQQLQHANRLAVLVPNRQRQYRFRPESQPQIHFGLKSRIGVRVFQIDALAVLRHPSRNSAICWQPDFLLVEPQSNQRPDFIVLAVHQKNSPALRARMPRGQVAE